MTLTRNLRRNLALAAALPMLVAAPAFAQDSIVVQGERIETADVRNTARDITIGARSMQVPLARFQRPVCPGVWGLSEENARAVLDRITANAIAADIPVAQEDGCGANVWVIIVDDASATFERLEEEDSFLTRHLTPYQRRKVRDQEGAALGWNLTTTRNPDTGERVPTGFEATQGFIEARSSGQPDPVNEVSNMSRLTLGIRTDLELSVVVIERDAIAALDSYAVADYATMRLLAYTEPPSEEGAISTVLTLFVPGAEETTPQRLTTFDQAYLRTLYRSNPVRPARMAMGNISGMMEEIEIEVPSEEVAEE